LNYITVSIGQRFILIVVETANVRPARANTGLDRQARTFIEQSDEIAELLRVERRPADRGEPECSLSELRVLSLVGKHQSVTMSEIAKELKAPLSSATRVIDKLVEKKLVARRRSRKDRRIVEVTFSERGREINEFVVQTRRALGRGLLLRLQPAARTRLLRGMSSIVAAGRGKS
jgi:DNA-binding MarR family transcriptional regulator